MRRQIRVPKTGFRTYDSRCKPHDVSIRQERAVMPKLCAAIREMGRSTKDDQVLEWLKEA